MADDRNVDDLEGKKAVPSFSPVRPDVPLPTYSADAHQVVARVLVRARTRRRPAALVPAPVLAGLHPRLHFTGGVVHGLSAA